MTLTAVPTKISNSHCINILLTLISTVNIILILTERSVWIIMTGIPGPFLNCTSGYCYLICSLGNLNLEPWVLILVPRSWLWFLGPGLGPRSSGKKQATSLYWFAAQQQTSTSTQQKVGLFYSKFNEFSLKF